MQLTIIGYWLKKAESLWPSLTWSHKEIKLPKRPQQFKPNIFYSWLQSPDEVKFRMTLGDHPMG